MARRKSDTIAQLEQVISELESEIRKLKRQIKQQRRPDQKKVSVSKPRKPNEHSCGECGKGQMFYMDFHFPQYVLKLLVCDTCGHRVKVK